MKTAEFEVVKFAKRVAHKQLEWYRQMLEAKKKAENEKGKTP